MKKVHGGNLDTDLLSGLSIDCEKCSGLCCVALYFAESEGFPTDKKIGKPCDHLSPDFRCAIHPQLSDHKLKGCLAFDCLGAGQKVTQAFYSGENWRTTPTLAHQMYDVFLVIWQLHQMLWYLAEASTLLPAKKLQAEIEALILENTQMTQRTAEEILLLDIAQYKSRVNLVLKKAGKLVLVAFGQYSRRPRNMDYMGRSFRKANLDGRDFSMALLIAANLEGCSLYGANFLGADLRDANLKNADLSESIFLTQGQLNAAHGNHKTKLPKALTSPVTWKS